MGVQIPDLTALPQVTPRAVDVLPQYPQESALATGEANLGAGVQKAGGTVEDIAAYSKLARNRADRGTAEAAFAGDNIRLTEALQNETDPEKITALKGQFAASLENAKSAFNDPDAAARWANDQAHVVASGEAHADTRNVQVFRDRYRAGIDAQANDLATQGATASDPNAFDVAKNAIGLRYQSARDSGALTAEDAYLKQKAAEHQLIEGRALNLANNGQADAALKFLDEQGGDMPPVAREQLRANIAAKDDKQDARNYAAGVRQSWDSGTGAAQRTSGGMGVGGAIGSAIAGEAQQQNVDPKTALTTAQIESSMGQNLGSRGNIFQLGKTEWSAVGGGQMGEPTTDIKNGVAWLGKTQNELADKLGRQPDGWETYLAHQQGVAGATKLLNNPDSPAGLLVGAKAISGNGGDPKAPASAFIAKWRNTFNQTAAGFGSGLAPPSGALPQGQAPLTAGADTAAAPAPTGVPPKIDLAFGDSISAQQIRHGAGGAEDAQFKTPGQPLVAGKTAGVSDPPDRVLARINATDPKTFAGKTVFLSTGASNNPNQVALAADQVQALHKAGAAAIVIPGVGPGVKDADQVNAQLSNIAQAGGATFFQPQVKWQPDGVHPAEVIKVQDQARQALAGTTPAAATPATTPGGPDQMVPATPGDQTSATAQQPATGQGGAAPAPASQGALPAPDLDVAVSDILAQRDRGEINDSRAAARIQAVEAQYRQWHVATNGDRAALKQTLSGGIAMLASGKDFQYSENRIRQLFPKAEADSYVQQLQDAQDQGYWQNYVSGSSPDQLAGMVAKLRAGLDLDPNPLNFARRARGVAHLEAAAEKEAGQYETEATRQAVGGLPQAPVPDDAVQGKIGAEDLREFARGSPEHQALAQQLGQYPSEADAQRRQRLLDHFDAAVVQHYRGLATDPAGYVVSSNPDVQAKVDQAWQQRTPQAFGDYASAVLGMQDHLGLKPEQQHILAVPQARGIVQRLTADPENAPARFRGMEQSFGQYWPKVWQDLATVGKLPGSWQLVGQLADYDQENAGLLARQLSQQPKDQRDSALKERPGPGAKSVEAQIAEAIDTDGRVQQFDRSMANGFVSEGARNEIVGAIHSLAKARFLYAREEPAAAARKAVDAAIGHYRFDPNSGARAPDPIFDAVSEHAGAVVGGLSPATVAVPEAFRMPEQPTTAPGMLTPGNIDLLHRPQVKTPEGTATVNSMSINEDGREILIPRVAQDGSRVLTDQEAIQQYHRSGQHLGMFDNADSATAYAERLHQAQAALISRVGGPTPEDYVAQLKARPTWINAPRNDGWWLVDRGGRFVMDTQGNHVAVPFSAAILPPRSQPEATPLLPSPVSPF